MRIASFFISATLAALPAQGFSATAREQLVIVSFDGAHDNALWVKSRAMAERVGAHFTYFLSCTFLMSPERQKTYEGPHHRAGRSNVGFAKSRNDVRIRLDHIWNAHLEGHDIGSHACGHFDGGNWTKADWLEEFASFRQALLAAWRENGVESSEPEGWAEFVKNDIKGFRAPYLSAGKALTEAEREVGFTYDASLVTRGPAMPVTDGQLVRFGLPLIPEGPEGRRIIAMDYNLYVRHSHAKEEPEESAAFENRAYDAFKAAFDRQYDGERIPLQLGFHFVEMNAGAYWRALDRFVTDVCRKPDVACVSYTEALARLNGAPERKKAADSAY